MESAHSKYKQKARWKDIQRKLPLQPWNMNCKSLKLHELYVIEDDTNYKVDLTPVIENDKRQMYNISFIQ